LKKLKNKNGYDGFEIYRPGLIKVKTIKGRLVNRSIVIYGTSLRVRSVTMIPYDDK